MLQLLKGIAILHSKAITHRDLKPSNILISVSKHKAPNNRSSKMEESVVVRLADFGSAVDAYTFHEFYEGNPTQAEETREYQPPEVLFNELGIVYDYENPTSYDLWSTGIIFLELILGSPQVFLISARDRVKLDVKLRGKDEQTKLKSYLLHVITDEFCIFQPEYNQLQHFWNKYALVTRGCHFGQFNATILKRDPFHKGFQDPWGLDLIWKLLQWDPKQRISAKEALRHAFFVGPYICNETGRAFATKKELSVHLSYLETERKRQREFAHLVRDRVEIPAEFKCPKCARVFSTNLACQAHALARKHAQNHAFCSFDDRVLNDAIRSDTEAAVPSPPDVHVPVGYALFQGKRTYMEDLLVVERNATLGYTMYAIMDGHLGTATARFVKEHIFQLICDRLSRAHNTENAAILETLIRQTFLELQSAYLEFRAIYESDFSGCTLTIALIDDLQQQVICGNVGDSRAVLYHIGAQPYLTELSHDHVPNDVEERRRIESNGGFVSFVGLWRVVGQLAVSRSIGDHHLRKYVSADPHVRTFDLTKDRSGRILVLASDGLWEVMTNTDVQAYLEGCMQNLEHSTQELNDIALALVAEAYTRGSLDNIAAILVWLDR
uniref:Protein phosphatase 1Llike protein putative n=1 Tax=Albugo laibachii Nc14 TaxID=890382 RepID=F0X0Q1_9STRA|nr:protein phosphatase 1Llike protein putative [Albugo laibachii Nc14]|eukprot:CCA27345.1 protein phosphatase 1Llike protein putative [Albugo laibachii Nc14]